METRGVLCWAGKDTGHPPVVVSKAWPPVGGPQQCLHGTGQVHKHVTHQEEPRTQKGPRRGRDAKGGRNRKRNTRKQRGEEGTKLRRCPEHIPAPGKGFKSQIPFQHTLMHVGMNLHITKDRLLHYWVGYPGGSL